MSFSAFKAPQELIDFSIDWAAELTAESPADSISTSSWRADFGLVIDSSSNTSTTAEAWVSGGTIHKMGRVTNTIVTSGGRTYERSVYLKIQAR